MAEPAPEGLNDAMEVLACLFSSTGEDPAVVAGGAPRRINNSSSSKKQSRSSSYLPAEDLIVCKAYIAASEDPTVGTSKAEGL